MFTNVPTAVRAIRLSKGWSQSRLGERAGVSREAISRTERGELRGATVATVERIALALGASVSLQLRWHGEQLDRLVDAAHAAMQQELAASLNSLGWLVRVEVSFNHYGDRGRIDIVALHPVVRTLLVVEVKSGLGDIQETLGRLDVKARVGRVIARELGWADVVDVVPALVIGDSRAARRAVAAHASLFARFDVRGRAAVAWLRWPKRPAPTGLLWFATRRDSRHVTNSRVRRASERPESQDV